VPNLHSQESAGSPPCPTRLAHRAWRLPWAQGLGNAGGHTRLLELLERSDDDTVVDAAGVAVEAYVHSLPLSSSSSRRLFTAASVYGRCSRGGVCAARCSCGPSIRLRKPTARVRATQLRGQPAPRVRRLPHARATGGHGGGGADSATWGSEPDGDVAAPARAGRPSRNPQHALHLQHRAGSVDRAARGALPAQARSGAGRRVGAGRCVRARETALLERNNPSPRTRKHTLPDSRTSAIVMSQG
jgi:hypothetical protein